MILKKLINIGVQHAQTEREKRVTKIMNIMSISILLFVVVYLVTDIFLPQEHVQKMLFHLIFLIVINVIALSLNYIGKLLLSKVLFLILIMFVVFYVAAISGIESFSAVGCLTLIPMTALIFTKKEKIWRIVFFIIPFIIFSVVEYFDYQMIDTHPTTEQMTQDRIVNMLFNMFIVLAIIYSFISDMETSEETLQGNVKKLEVTQQVMKAQEVELQENVEELRTQEEELRQNMEELQTTQEVLAHQKEELEGAHRQTKKSIRYAYTIQDSFLPPLSLFDSLLSESFVLYKPKDIVSGDAYWISQHDDKILVGVIDCTGHGVPGAFISLVAMNLLDEITNQDSLLSPSAILTKLHEKVVASLSQKEGTNNDGMDLSLCLLEPVSDSQNRLTFGGAKQNLYIFRNQELIELKGNRRSIGGNRKLDNRIYHEESFLLHAEDAIYLATDGYTDQANTDRKNFSKKRFRELIQDIGHLSMNEQGKVFDNKLTEHQQDAPQRDDITLIGFRV